MRVVFKKLKLGLLMIWLYRYLLFSCCKTTIMKKVFLGSVISLVCIFLIVSSANAQLKKPGITLGGSLLYSMPKGDFDKAYKFGIGGEAYAGVGWGQTFLIGTVGYSGYQPESGNSAGTLNYIPVKLGLKQFFLMKRLFINADLGIASVKNKNMSESAFTRGIGAGVRLLGMEAGLYYDGFKIKNADGFSNSLNAKLGWSFSL
jgi:hypothetical protein